MYRGRIVYRGSAPRGGLTPPSTTNFRNLPAAGIDSPSQAGRGVLDFLRKKFPGSSRVRSVLRSAGQRAGRALVNEAKKQTWNVARDVLSGKNLKEAVKDGSLQAVRNLRNDAVREVARRLPAHAGTVPNYHSDGRGLKRVQAQQDGQPGPPPTKKPKKGKKTTTTNSKKKAGRKGMKKKKKKPPKRARSIFDGPPGQQGQGFDRVKWPIRKRSPGIVPEWV